MTGPILPPGCGWYLYGIAQWSEAESRLARETAGVDDLELVVGMRCGELAALVSAVSLAEFAAEQVRSRAQDGVWLERVAREHQRVVDALHRRLTIVPARLFCVYAGDDEIRASLAEKQSSFLRSLQRLADCDEFEVRLTCERELLRTNLSRSHPRIVQLMEARAAATPGRAYLADRQIATLLERNVDATIEGVAEQAFSELRSRAIAGRDLSPMRGVFLVRRAQRGEFFEAVERVGRLRAETRVEYSGPWPPYNFVDADVLEEHGSIQG